MKQLLNTLYITTPNTYIHRDGTNIVVEAEHKEMGRVPIHNIQSLICFGSTGASPGLMSLCAENNVSISFMKQNGRFIASVNGETKGNVLLRRTQYRIADDESASLIISRNMIVGKLVNCRTVLKKGLANHQELRDDGQIPRTIESINQCITSVQNCNSNERLRALEGNIAKEYFTSLDKLILKNKDSFFMIRRSRRPPRDRFNAILSFLYSMLANDVRSALESIGLDPYVGFLHTDRPGRPSLALDLMEELRPIADRVALRLVNLCMVSPDGFIDEGTEAFLMDDDTRATVISEWQRTKQLTSMHRFIKEQIQLGMAPFTQSMLLAKYIRGELNGYPPYILER